VLGLKKSTFRGIKVQRLSPEKKSVIQNFLIIMKHSPSLDIEQCDTEGMRNDIIVNELFSYDTLN
jgi:hypothetical protein